MKLELQCLRAWEMEQELKTLGHTHLAVAAAWGDKAGREYTRRGNRIKRQLESLMYQG